MVVGGIQHGAVVTFRDISEETRVRRALQDNETKLHQVNETLESRVQERTRELAAALEAAEMAKRSRGQFLANMSHEIRTPMNSVMGMVYLALKTDPNPVQRDYLEKIQKSGAHLLSIINDILDYSKIDAGKLELESGIFDLEQVLQHMVNVVGGKASEKGLGLRLEVDPDVPKLLRGDALRLGQILINFLNNAVKFTAQGGVVIRVHKLPLPQSADVTDLCQLRFEVEDTGIGIDESQCARLFESFEQGDQSTTRKYGGTGLGLAISRQLANLMGGEIGVSSRLGVGSIFWFIAHFHQAHDARQLVRPLTSVQDAMASLRGKHVLVADDNEFNLDVARGLLQDIGVRVATADNGALAVDAVRGTAFDCVLMDMQMPVMDGLLATRTIRSDPAIAHMVVIAMTANAGQEDLNRCLQAGMNEVLTKPIDPDLLFLTLAKWLREPYRHSVAPLWQSTPTTPTVPQPPAVPMVKSRQPDVSALPVWDASALTRIVGDNPTAHARLLDKYLLTAKETVAAIRSNADGGQWIAVADQAHKLKSSSRSVGAMQLGALCESLEHAGRGNKADLCEALVQSVTRYYALVLARITEQRSAT
jgi:signal transduction histidine kinase/CheY-like chemotaxis protein